MLTRKDKDIFLDSVITIISEDPEFVTEIYGAIQRGIRERLNHEMHERSALAAGFSLLWEFPNGKKKYREQLAPQAEALARYYEGAPFAQKVREWLREIDK